MREEERGGGRFRGREYHPTGQYLERCGIPRFWQNLVAWASFESSSPFCLAAPAQGGDISAYVCNRSQKSACFKCVCSTQRATLL